MASKAGDAITTLMGTFMRETGKMIWSQAEARCFIRMEIFIRVLGSKEKEMVKEFTIIIMDPSTKEVFQMEKNQDSG